MPYTLLLKRGIAQLIDLLLFYFGVNVYYEIVNADNPMAYDRIFNGVFELITFIPIWIIYSFVLEWATQGYSVGKWILSLRIVRVDGRPIGFKQVFLRWLGNWPDFYLTLGAGAVMSVLTSSRQQRIGDQLAGTILRGYSLRALLRDLRNDTDL